MDFMSKVNHQTFLIKYFLVLSVECFVKKNHEINDHDHHRIGIGSDKTFTKAMKRPHDKVSDSVSAL
jgi:hypothetical protein